VTAAAAGGVAPAGSPEALEREWRARHNQWAVAMTVTLATFMEILDTSIANVSLPHIAGGLSTGYDESTWILTSYLVSNAIVLPISGWFSNLIGRKRFYMTCVALFTTSSLLCGLAPSLGMLVLFRVLQGAGGGGLQPSEQSILADTFVPAERGMAFAAYGMAIVLAPVIGPTLGGWITDNWNWRWIFFINVPVGVVSLLLSYRVVEDPPWLSPGNRDSNRGGIDYIGLGLVAVGLGCLQVVLDKGQREDWFESGFITSFSIVSAAALIAFIVWELRQRDPVVDLRLFKMRNFAMSNLMMFVMGLALYGSVVLLPQFLQQLMGYSATQAGMVLSPGGLAVMALMPLVGMLIVRVSARSLIACGFIAMSWALFQTTNLNQQVDFFTVMMYRVYQSIGLAFLFIPISTVAYVGVPQEDNNTVSGMINLARNIGASVGVSLVETMLARRTQVHQDRLITHLTGYDSGLGAAARGLGATLFHHGLSRHEATQQAYGRLYGAMTGQAAMLAYVDALWVMGVACAVMVPLAFLMEKNDPRTASLAVH
jgi:MFS transporter, DHA2 family, multidrug resistance protein